MRHRFSQQGSGKCHPPLQQLGAQSGFSTGTCLKPAPVRAQHLPAGCQACSGPAPGRAQSLQPDSVLGMLFVCDSHHERGVLITERSCPAICSGLITVSFVPMAGQRDHYQLRNTSANNSIAPNHIPAFSLFQLFGSITAYTNSHQLLTPLY